MALVFPIQGGRRLSLSLPTSLPHLPIFFFASVAGPPASCRAGYRAKRARGGGAMPLCVNIEAAKTEEPFEGAADGWRKVSAVLFDMDGVLCDSEHLSRLAAVNLFAEMGVSVTPDDFVPFMGTGEANFLGGVASLKGIKDFDPRAAKKRFFEIYLDKYAKPNSGIGFPGAFELLSQCKEIGLKIAVTSSADRIKVNANLNAADLPVSLFDAIVSADEFENLKPAPDIFLAASKYLNVPVNECVVIEDALTGIQAAKAAKMRCIAVKTTLSEEVLLQECPSLIRKDIGDIVLEDIINGGRPSSEQLIEKANENSHQDVDGDIPLRLQISRRDIVRYGSLGISFSCLLFAATNWKAMQYASPNGVLNMLLGSTNRILDLSEGGLQSTRVQQFVSFINDLETRGTARSVPEFQSKLDWLNTAPLSWSRDLKGKVVLLDFWTYCCINCMHVLPDLEFLEKKYINKPFTVIGVHSAKFDNEKDLEAIRNAVLRYNISHPVVNDGEMYLWRALGINSWPTFALVGPGGKVIAQISGEGHKKDLDDLVEAAFLYYGEKKALDSTPLPLALEKDNDPRLSTSPLRFPGKLAIDVLNNRLFISDSNHNRIVVTDLSGNYILQVGSSGQGLNDGTFDSATFNRPQGLAYNPKKNLLYVADTENHALREIDFVTEMVRTLAGNGTKGSDYTGGGKGLDQVLNSPWDVCFDSVNELVYIAMAGQHQIWVHNVKDGITRVFSGDGFERNLNGSSSSSTSFAQPSGISIFPGSQEAYIADSESSSIRSLDLKTGGSRLIAGGDPMFAENLFRFGDHDGIGTDALLQHPLGILCAKNKAIYVADSYNHKIKKLDRMNRKVITVAGTGKAGFKDGRAQAAQLSEPSGIVEDGSGKFFVADTNNNLIRVLELKGDGFLLSTLELKGVRPPSPKQRSMRRLRRKLSSDTEIVKVGGVLSRQGNLNLRITVPEGYHLSKEAKSKFEVEVEPANGVVVEPLDGFLSPEGSASLQFERSSPSAASGRINCKVYYCKEDEVCLYQSLAFEVPFEEVVGDSANNVEVNLQYIVKPRVDGGRL